jgi:hypothetical protein
VPTATWFSGQTSAAAGGAGYGTGSYTTTNASYNSPTAGSLLCVWVFGITNAASEITGGSFSSSVGSGTNPTFNQHTAGWVTGSAVGSIYTPFASMFYTTLGTCTNLRFICDATDDIYQWFVVWVEYTNFDSGTPFGRWGSDTGNGDTADNESTDLDQNTGGGNVATTSHVVGCLVADGAGGAVDPGSGWVERYEGPSGGGQTMAQLQDDQDPTDNTIEWGTVTPTTFAWCTLAVEVRDSGTTTGTSAQTLADFTSTASGTVNNPPVVLYVKEVGFVTNTSAGTTSAITVAAGGVPIGDYLVIYGACDNTGTNGVATTISVADDSNNAGSANTYTLQTPQAIADPGAAAAGCQGFFVVCPVTRSLDAGDTITITYGNSTTAKAINCQQFTPSISGNISVLASSYARQDNQTGQSVSVAAGTNPTMAGQVVCTLVAVEGGTADAFTQDTDTTNGTWVTLTRRGSGTTTSGSTLNSTYKALTAAGAQTYNHATMLGTARDHCAAILVLAPPPITGTVAQTLANFTSTASGDVTSGATGTVAVTLEAFTSTASGTETFTGTSAQTLANATSAASGWHTISGTSAQTLADFTSTATGTETISGTSAQTFADFTSSASGTETITGTSAQTLADFTSTASGDVTGAISGTSAQTLADFTSTASGTETFTGTSAQTLTNFTSTASGWHTISGTSAQTLADFTSSASGTSQVNITGTSAQTLADFTSTASGTVTVNVTGTAAQTLADFTSTAAGSEVFTGTSAQTLAAFTSTATGVESFTGTSAQTLADYTSAASGQVAFIGTTTVTLVDFTSTASGALVITGTVAVTLADFTGLGLETPPVRTLLETVVRRSRPGIVGLEQPGIVATVQPGIVKREQPGEVRRREPTLT